MLVAAGWLALALSHAPGSAGVCFGHGGTGGGCGGDALGLVKALHGMAPFVCKGKKG